ncbi:MAG: DNA alkylation repair protein [Peptococcaceae bacterium]|nr:DNA alkylation repair protein [Peptococcaceae bacterium]
MKYKDYYDDQYVDMISRKLTQAHSQFESEIFVSRLQGKLEGLSLFERFDLVVDALERSLPNHYADNIVRLFHLLEEELPTDSGMFREGWWYWPIGRYVEKNGVLDFEVSMSFIKELTKRFTGEYAVRPLLEQYPQQAMSQLIEWSQDENVHVRRLASEGVRIRLPWSKKLYTALDEFDSYVRILDNLKDDPAKFVQKSVGNNLNDLYKEAPEKARFIIDAWQRGGLTKATRWIIAHGTRSLKQEKELFLLHE